MKKQWNIAGLVVPAGEKVNTILSVPGTEEKIPATFINGKEPGQTLPGELGFARWRVHRHSGGHRINH